MTLSGVSASSVGLDPAGIIDFLGAQRRDNLEMHSLVILRGGQVVTQHWWSPYSASQLQLVYSFSKTLTSAAVGLAVGDGAFGYQDKLVDLWADELAGAPIGPKARTTTVANLLAMASGHLVDLLQRPVDFADPEIRAYLRLVTQEPDGEPGKTFAYNNLATYGLSVLVHQRTGRTVSQLLAERVWPALGVTRYGWTTDAAGRDLGFSGAHLDTETMALFIQLIAQGGQWQGQQILDPEWISQVSQVQSVNLDPTSGPDWRQGYGWQMWRCQHGFRADGAHGQFGLIIPEADLVVVMTSALRDMQASLTNVWEHLLPAADRRPTASDDALQTALEAEQLLDFPLAERDAGNLPPANETFHVTEAGAVWQSPVDEQVIPAPSHDWTPAVLAIGASTLPVSARRVAEGVDVVVRNGPHRLLIAPDGRAWWNVPPLMPGGLVDLAVRPRDLHGVDPRDW